MGHILSALLDTLLMRDGSSSLRSSRSRSLVRFIFMEQDSDRIGVCQRVCPLCASASACKMQAATSPALSYPRAKQFLNCLQRSAQVTRVRRNRATAVGAIWGTFRHGVRVRTCTCCLGAVLGGHASGASRHKRRTILSCKLRQRERDAPSDLPSCWNTRYRARHM